MYSKALRRIICAILAALAVLSVAAVSFFAQSVCNTVVTTDALRLRSSPEISDDNFIVTLGVYEELTLLENSENGWAKVQRENGEVGYCSVEYLDVPENSAVKTVAVTTDTVNFRKAPSTESEIIKCLDPETELLVTDNTDDLWIKALSDDTPGYIYRDYVSLSFRLAFESEDVTEATESTAFVNVTQASSEDISDTLGTLTSTSNSSESQDTALEAPKTPRWYSDYLCEDSASGISTSLSKDFVLSDSQLTLKSGDTYKLSVLILGGSLDNSVSFSSSDSSVAAVTESGTVSALSQGSAVITASFNEKNASCKVTVTKGEDAPDSSEPTTSKPYETEPTTEPDASTALKLSSSALTVEKGNLCVITSSEENTSWSSSNPQVASVDNNGFITGVSTGQAIITAVSGEKTGTCTVTVVKADSSLEIEYTTVKLSKGKTFYNSAESDDGISWTSSDTSVATVSNGFITGLSEGTALISASTSKSTKTCKVSVTAAEPVRFAYTYPNTAAKNEEVTLVAVTDKTRTAVQFKIKENSNVKTVDATSKKADGNTLVWTAVTSFSKAGTYSVTAYSKLGSVYTSCDGGETTAFVRQSDDLLTQTNENRRVSDELISLLSSFEGYVGNVYFDTLAGGIPTLGFGKVVYTGDSFYNDMTKTEAYALLYDTVNNGGYSSNVNSYLQDLEANYNQQQFDALVSFAYNIGYYGLKSDSELRALILESKEKKTSASSENAAYINGTQVNFRSGAGTQYESLGLLNYPEALTLLDTKPVSDVWYHVKTADGTEGYVYKDYVTLGSVTVEGDIYLSLIDKSEFSRVMLEYHHAGGSCIYGLLYRRVDELDVFFYGDYERDGSDNSYGYSFVCVKDNSFKL